MPLHAWLIWAHLVRAPVATPEFVPPERVDSVQAERPSQVPSELRAEVVLALVLDEQGLVVDARILESGGAAFDDAALRAARTFRFTPAMEAGVPISVEIEFVYVFEPVSVVAAGVDEVETVAMVEPEVEPTEETLDVEQAEKVAGSQGDAIKAAQVLGGVSRPALGTGELVIWGADPGDSRRQVDWILVPRLFHLGGGRSILPSPRVESVSVVPGGFGPRYGRALGGLIVVHTADSWTTEGTSRDLGGYARIDPIDVGVGVDTTAGERGRIALSARRTILNQTLGRAIPESSRQVVPLPESWDYQARSDVSLRHDLSLQVLGLGAEDRLIRTLPSRTDDVAFEERVFAGFHRLGARLVWTDDNGGSAEVAAWFGVDRDRATQDFSSVAVRSRADTWRGGVRLAQTRVLRRWFELRWGIDAEIARASLQRDGALTLPAREGDIIVFGQPPGDRVAGDAWASTQGSVAAYGTAGFSWAEGRWRFEPGVRIEPMAQAGDRILPVRPVEPEVGYADVEVAVQPRGQLRWAPSGTVEAFVAGGRTSRAPDAADLSPIFGNPRLRVARADHGVVGVRVDPLSWMSVGVTGFIARSRRRTGRSQSATPPTAGLLESVADGRNFGGQAVVRTRLFGSVSTRFVYAWTRSERRDPDVDHWRLSDFDQPHQFTALGDWEHRSGFSIGARTTVTSGFPRTEVIDSVPNTRTGEWDPVFGGQNETRLPVFFELSLRAAYTRTRPWGTLRAWLDLQNATNRANATEFFYASDYRQRDVVRGLPILPMLGVEVRR